MNSQGDFGASSLDAETWRKHRAGDMNWSQRWESIRPVQVTDSSRVRGGQSPWDLFQMLLHVKV